MLILENKCIILGITLARFRLHWLVGLCVVNTMPYFQVVQRERVYISLLLPAIDVYLFNGVQWDLLLRLDRGQNVSL